MAKTHDPYARVHYRHMIAWPERLRREGPLLGRLLLDGPEPRVLDLGSGPGDHARYLASRGLEVVGVDASESMLEMATAEEVPPGVTFILGDFRKVDELVEGKFGGAICLGNVLPHLTEEADLRLIARALSEVLLPGSKFLLQMLNYQRFEATGERSMPVNVRPDPEGGEGLLVFLRMMTLMPEGKVLFYPSTLRLTDREEMPLEVLQSKRIELRAWRREEIAQIFGAEGIVESEVLGGYDEAEFDPAVSRDLLWVGERV